MLKWGQSLSKVTFLYDLRCQKIFISTKIKAIINRMKTHVRKTVHKRILLAKLFYFIV